AFAIRTLPPRPNSRRALAHRTHFLPRDVQPQHRAPDCLPKTDVDLILEVSSRFGTLRFRSASGKDAGENVAKAATAGALARSSSGVKVGEIESAEIKWNALSSAAAAVRTTGKSARKSL